MIQRLRRMGHIIALMLRGSWRQPGHADVLVLFPDGVETLAPLLDRATYSVLDPREHSINTRVALHCFLRRRFSAIDYIVEYTSRVRPRILLTFLDNYWPFYELKSRLPEVTTVAVQNGVRGPSDDVFGHAMAAARESIASWHVDHLCVFGPAVGREYAKYVNGGVDLVGSVKNNAVSLTGPTGPLVGYVSTWRGAVAQDRLVTIHGGSRSVTVGQLYQRRDRLVRYLDGYARSRGSHLLVVGKDPTGVDRHHYAHLLGHEDFEYSLRAGPDSSYRAIDRARLVVFSSSTLGYEALARGHRVAAFFTDIEITASDGERFGWPLDLPDDGPFWTHRYDEVRFGEILDDLGAMSNEEWSAMSDPIASDLIVFDDGNTAMRHVLQSALTHGTRVR